MLHVRPFEPGDKAAMIALWERAGLTRPWNDPAKDIQRKWLIQRELFLVGTLNGAVVASAMGGYDGHRGWVYYLATDPAHQRKGYARTLMHALEERLLAMGCPKINLQIRDTNTEAIAFYEGIGYKTDPVLSMGKRLIPDT